VFILIGEGIVLEGTIVKVAFEYCEQNQVQTARLLDISRNVLRHKLGLYGMLPTSNAFSSRQ
jgi:sigma-54-specific transcriptional regulator